MTRDRFRFHRGGDGFTDGWLVIVKGRLSVSASVERDWNDARTVRVGIHTEAGSLSFSGGWSS